jgi:hypothetical protein
MGHRYYLYGSDRMGIQEVCDALSASLGISFNARESDFKGGRYYIAQKSQGAEKITVERNWEDDEGYLAEPQFPKCSTLVYVAEPTAHLLSTLEHESRLQRLRVESVDY